MLIGPDDVAYDRRDAEPALSVTLRKAVPLALWPPRIVSVAVKSSAINDVHVFSLARQYPMLTSLDVSKTEGVITDASISLIAQHCPRRQHCSVFNRWDELAAVNPAVLSQ